MRVHAPRQVVAEVKNFVIDLTGAAILFPDGTSDPPPDFLEHESFLWLIPVIIVPILIIFGVFYWWKRRKYKGESQGCKHRGLTIP